jgi:hypothetical protein
LIFSFKFTSSLMFLKIIGTKGFSFLFSQNIETSGFFIINFFKELDKSPIGKLFSTSFYCTQIVINALITIFLAPPFFLFFYFFCGAMVRFGLYSPKVHNSILFFNFLFCFIDGWKNYSLQAISSSTFPSKLCICNFLRRGLANFLFFFSYE